MSLLTLHSTHEPKVDRWAPDLHCMLCGSVDPAHDCPSTDEDQS